MSASPIFFTDEDRAGTRALTHEAEPWVPLLDVDADLDACIPASDMLLARRALRAPSRTIARGPVELGALELPHSTFALLVVEGELTRDLGVAGRSMSEMVLPGDVLSSCEPQLDGLEVTRRLVARRPVVLAILDARFLLACARWPALMVSVQRRISEQEHRLAAHGAICQLSRVSERLLEIMRHRASRVGRVCPEGTIVPIAATHEELGRLVGARRPTITLALKDLGAAGLLRRRPDGTWLLPKQDISPPSPAPTHEGGFS